MMKPLRWGSRGAGALLASVFTLAVAAPSAFAAKNVPLASRVAQPVSAAELTRAQDGLCGDFVELATCPNVHESANLSHFMGRIDNPAALDVLERAKQSYSPVDLARHPGGCDSPGNYTVNGLSGAALPLTRNTGCGGARLSGWINVTGAANTPVTWTIGLHGNDSARLLIGGVQIADMDWTRGDWKRYEHVVFPEPGLYPIEVQWATNHNCNVDPLELVYAPSAVAGFDNRGCSTFGGLGASCTSAGTSPPFQLMNGSVLISGTNGDADNDGIPNFVEGGGCGSTGPNTDGDALPDYLDNDDDNDGIPSSVEGADPTLDSDNDGLPDYRDAKDLVITQIDTSALSTNLQTRRTQGAITVSFKNQGVTRINSPYRVTLFIDRDGDGTYSAMSDTALGFVDVTGTTSPNSVLSATLSGVSTTLDFAGQPIYAFVDSELQIREDNAEGNNIAHSGQTRCASQLDPDLTLSSIRYDISAHPNSIALTVRVGNGGQATLPANTIVSFYDGNGALMGSALTTQPLAPNAFEDLSILWMTPPMMLSPDALSVEVRGDELNLVPECDQSNNTHSISYPIGVDILTPAQNAALTSHMPTLSGTGRPNTRVRLELRDGGNNLLLTVNNLPVDAMGAWSFNTTQALPDGAYTLTAIPSDEIGNIGLPDVHSFALDATAPDIIISAPADNSSTNDDTPTISGLTNEPGATITVVLRDVQNNVVQTLTTTADAMGVWQVDAAPLAPMSYAVTAIATDAAGNVSPIAGPNTFNVDLTAPTVALVTPVDGSSSNDATPTISGSAEPSTQLSISITDVNGVVVQTLTTTANAQGQWSIDATTLADGSYQASVTATDAAGNTATAGPHSFTIDTTAPALTLDSPSSGTTSQDNAPNILGTSEPGVTVLVRITDAMNNVVFDDSVVTDGAGQWSVAVVPGLSDGTYQINATATDAAGNTSNAGPNTFTVDTTAPALTITSPADGATVASRRPTITGVTEAGLSVTVVVRDAQNMVVLTQTVSADAQGGYSVQPSADLADGSYSIEASTADAAGNSASATSSFNVNATALPVDLVTPADNALLSDNQPTISGTTAPSTMVSLTVRDAQNMVVAQLNATSDAQGDFSAALPMALADGAYTIEASVSNGAGVTSTDSSSFTVDTTAPAVSLISPASGASTNDTTPTISGAADPGAQLSISITDANGAVVQTLTATADAQGQWSVDAMTLMEGGYQASVIATDAAGNTATAGPNSFTVDTTAPALTVDTPVDGSVLGTRTAAVAGTGEPGASVEVELVDAQGVVLGTQRATVDQGGVWQVSFMGLANGDYTANASSTDAAGNSATATTGFSVDSQAPNLSVTTPAQDEVTSDDTPTISGTTDVGNVITVEILDNQGMVIQTYTPAVDQGGAWSVDATQLPEGDYQVKATASGQSGLDSEVVVDFSVDLTAPGVTLSEPADGLITAMNTLTATGTSDAGQEVVVSVKDAQGQEVFSGNVTADANGAWSLPLMMLNDGAYTVEATATDAAGNVATAGPNSFTIDTMAPTVTITSPAAGSTIEDATPTLTGTAEPGATVEILIDGVKVGEATADAQGSWSFDVVDALLPGSHTVEAKTTDEAGNEGSSGEVTFTLEAPTAPVVIISPTEGGTVTGPSVTVTGTGEPGQMVTVTIGEVSETVTVADDGSWSVTLDNIPAGDATITAQGEDGSSTSITITVEEADVPSTTGGYLVTGGACSQASKGAPLDLGLMVLFAGLGLALFRRRR